MKVLFVVHQFFPHFYTGVERYTLNLAHQFGRMGHASTILSVSPPDPDPQTLRKDYGYQGIHVVACKPSRAVEPRQDYDMDPGAEVFIDGILEEVKPDIVHVMHPRFLPEARLVAARKGIPVFIHLHDYWFACPRISLIRADGTLCIGARDGANCEILCGCAAGAGTTRMSWARRELALASGVFFPSLFLRDVFASQGFETDKWQWIAIGVDYNHVTPDQTLVQSGEKPGRKLKVRFLGTLLPHKGPHVLIEAASKMGGAAVEIVLHGSEFHEVEYGRRLREKALQDPRITFAGSYDHSDLAKILADTALVVVPSLWYENSPISAETAIAAGVPVIASDLGGMREMIERYKGGFLFPPGDAAALARLLVELAANPVLVEETRERMLRPPSLEEEAHRIEMVYREVLD